MSGGTPCIPTKAVTPLVEQMDLLRLGGVLRQMAANGQLIELRCEMPYCYCPWGRGCFVPKGEQPKDWTPNADHYPQLRKDRGHLVPWNVRLAHVHCNSVDFGRRMKIRAMIEKGSTLEEIADRLTRDEVPRPHGSTKWTAASVRRVFIS